MLTDADVLAPTLANSLVALTALTVRLLNARNTDRVDILSAYSLVQGTAHFTEKIFREEVIAAIKGAGMPRDEAMRLVTRVQETLVTLTENLIRLDMAMVERGYLHPGMGRT
jgi:hypothetical protein